MSLQAIFEEQLFLLPQQPKNEAEYGIIFLHSINIKEGLLNNGIFENDEDRVWTGIAQGWNVSQNGVYSLRYKNIGGEFCQFKFVIPSRDTKLYINATKLTEDATLLNYEIPIMEMNFKDLSGHTKMVNQYISIIVKNLLNKKTQSTSQKQEILQEKSSTQQPNGLFWNIPKNNTPFGQSDLYPNNNLLQQPSMGGNLMGPQYFQQQQQQRNTFQEPPGARFDPFSPIPGIYPFEIPNKKQQFPGSGAQFPF